MRTRCCLRWMLKTGIESEQPSPPPPQLFFFTVLWLISFTSGSKWIFHLPLYSLFCPVLSFLFHCGWSDNSLDDGTPRKGERKRSWENRDTYYDRWFTNLSFLLHVLSLSLFLLSFFSLCVYARARMYLFNVIRYPLFFLSLSFSTSSGKRNPSSVYD